MTSPDQIFPLVAATSLQWVGGCG